MSDKTAASKTTGDKPVYDKYQVRMHLTPAFAKAMRETPYDPSLKAIVNILKKHNATLSCQFDEFSHYVAAAAAHGDGDTTVAKWTRAVLAVPEKCDYFKTVFVAAVKGEQLFDRATADSLIADLFALKKKGIATKLSRISTDPAKNPQAPAQFR